MHLTFILSKLPHTHEPLSHFKRCDDIFNTSVSYHWFYCLESERVWGGVGGGQTFHFIGADVQLPPCLHLSRGGCHGDGVPLLTGALRNNALLNSA